MGAIDLIENHPKIAIGVAVGFVAILLLSSMGSKSSSPEAVAAQLAGQKLDAERQVELAKIQAGTVNAQTAAGVSTAKIGAQASTAQAGLAAGAQNLSTRLTAQSTDMANKLAAASQNLQAKLSNTLGQLMAHLQYASTVNTNRANIAISSNQAQAQQNVADNSSNNSLFGGLGALGLLAFL
jgi:hypothetical protein